MIQFDNPQAFFLLFLPFILIFLRKLNFLKKISFPVILADWHGRKVDPLLNASNGLRFFSKIIAILAFVLTVVAFADPVLRHQERIYTSRGTAVLFVVDVSPSMAAKDIANATRLNASKTAIKTMIENNENASFGLIAMGEEAVTVVPPTTDKNFFVSQMESLRCGTLGDGTAIGTGISSAVYHLSSINAPKKAIVLITDGENNAGAIHPETAASLAEKNEIDFYILGIGTNGTVQIEYTDPETGTTKIGFYESSFSREPLLNLAQAGNGKYFEIEGTDSLTNALNQISYRQNQNVRNEYFLRSVDEPLFKKILKWAIILILAGLFIRRLILKENFKFINRKRWLARLFVRIFAFASIVAAWMGLYFGEEKVPVQKNGKELCLVFDISYSMLAKDCSGMTRLTAAKKSAVEILNKMEENNCEIPVSLVVAKGDGIQIVPMTEDYMKIYSALENLSPMMMTSAGTNLSKGIATAIKSFSENSARSSNIWLFTDGEDTDGDLEPVLVQGAFYGIQISVIGFGSEKESEILAGDGKTKVKTAFRKEKLAGTIEKASGKILENEIEFFDSSKFGWAKKLYSSVADTDGIKYVVAYEVRKVSRHKEFILLSLLLYVVSVLISEWNFSRIRLSNLFKKKKLFLSGLIVFTMFMTGCSNLSAKKEILKGSWDMLQGNYENATAKFLKLSENPLISDFERQYAIFALSSAYLSLEENDAALERMEEIESSEIKDIAYSVNYNSGIVAYKTGNYEIAEDFFKKAIVISPEKINARVNLEFCKRKVTEKKAAENESVMNRTALTESDKDLEKSIFNMIREQESRQWKKAEKSTEDKIDY